MVFEEIPIFMTRPVVDTGGIITGGAAQVGSVGSHRGNALWHQLPGTDFVGAGLEEQLDRRQVGNRLGAHDVKPRHPVERLLQRNADQGLHFLRRKSEAGGLNLHAWRRELGKDIHRHVAQLGDRVEHQRRRDRNHQESKPQAGV